MNKTTTILLTLLIGFSSFASAKKPPEQLTESPINNKVQFLQAGTYRQVPLNLVKERLQGSTPSTDNELVPLDKVSHTQNLPESVRDDLWDLTHVDDNAEWYLGSGDAGDTMAVAFTPAAPCIVKEVYYQWFDGGNLVAFGAMLSDEAIENTDNGASTNWPRGDAPWSPIGELMTPPTPNTIEDYVADWSAQLDIGIIDDEFVVGDSTDINAVETFLIVIVKGGESPHPLASDVPDETYLWFGGPWTDPDGDITTPDGDWGSGYAWGSYQSSSSMQQGLIDNMILVKVEYPWGAPLAIQSMNQLNNTYDLGQFMPPPPGNTLTVYADLFDDVDDATGMAIDENDDVVAHYLFQGTTTDVELTANDIGADGNGIYTFDIFYSNANPGDVIEYWITATDNDGLASESMHMSFEIKAPSNPDSDLLVIRDRVSDRQRDLVEQVLDDNDFVYEVWDTFLENGIDGSVINYGWSNIIAYGWGNMTIPVIASEDDPGYAGFIDGGGNLILIDMDWFWGHHPDLPELTFAPGDFAYDYFGIASGLNDPGTIDTVEVTGEGVTAIDNPFTDAPLILRHSPYLQTEDAGWIDYLTAGDGTPIFYDDLGNLVGIAKDHDPGGEAIYLSFMADAAGDTTEQGEWIYTQFALLIEGTLSQFGIASPPVINLVGEGSTRYGVASGTTTATVNASGFDSDGELTSVVLKYSVDEGDEISVDMVPGEGSAHSVTFDIEGFSDASIVIYWAEATDDAGFTTVSGVGSFWGTSFSGSGAPVLYMRDHYAPYDDYGAGAADSVLRANMESVGIEYDTWAVWDNSSADYGTVLSNYSSVIYAGVYDWTPMPHNTSDNSLSEFVAGGGYMLFSSEEVLGTYGNWGEDYDTFWPGHFAYDVLGVEWVGNDWNYEIVAINDDGGTGLIDGFSEEDIALNAALDDLGSMADFCDPLYYDTPEELPVPFLGYDSNGAFYYYNSVINGNVAFTAFNISMLPDAEQQNLLANFMNWGGDAGTVSVTVDNLSGWNLVGLPAGVEDASWSAVYPDAVPGTLYEFSGTYVNASSLDPGNGYWLNFSDAGSTTITGTPITTLTVSLSAGWNLVSGISETTDVSAISDPGGIIVPGTVYGFTGTYAGASELTPGQGYWINANADGDITISTGGNARTIASFTDLTEKANLLSFNGCDLYFGVSIEEEDMQYYQLPPKPPAGAFDVRFADNMKVAENTGAIEIMNNNEKLSISYTINIDAGEQMRWVLTSDDGIEYELNESGEIVLDGNVSGFTLNKVPGIPLTYGISQNYPNPFNPETSIHYEIPKESFVTITVYNMMGQKVTDLVHGLRSPGYHQTIWNSNNMEGDPVSSGVYFYTIEADNFRTMKKMVLMK